jgi:hypothetical protein
MPMQTTRRDHLVDSSEVATSPFRPGKHNSTFNFSTVA